MDTYSYHQVKDDATLVPGFYCIVREQQIEDTIYITWQLCPEEAACTYFDKLDAEDFYVLEMFD